MGIGLGIIGINPTNMGSTTALLKDVPDLKYELRGMCATRGDVLGAYAEQIGVDFWTTNYQELIRRDDIDVISVYSPDHLHAEHCIRAIEAGKHVFVQSQWLRSWKTPNAWSSWFGVQGLNS